MQILESSIWIQFYTNSEEVSQQGAVEAVVRVSLLSETQPFFFFFAILVNKYIYDRDRILRYHFVAYFLSSSREVIHCENEIRIIPSEPPWRSWPRGISCLSTAEVRRGNKRKTSQSCWGWGSALLQLSVFIQLWFDLILIFLGILCWKVTTPGKTQQINQSYSGMDQNHKSAICQLTSLIWQ